MVNISGVREREIELVNKDGYEVVVFSGWKNWEKYFDKYVNMRFLDKDDGHWVELKPEYQWQWSQNYPELVVEDVVKNWQMDSLWKTFDTYDDARNFVYGDLLYRGVNKWLMVRYLFIRYKKMIAEERNEAWKKYVGYRIVGEVFENLGYDNQLIYDCSKYKYWEGYWKGYYDAMMRVRADLKTMAMTLRYVVWNADKPGFVVDKKISKGWLRLVKELYSARFVR